MKFRINYDGKYQDSFIIYGTTIEEIREKAYEECGNRGWDINSCWSEQLD